MAKNTEKKSAPGRSTRKTSGQKKKRKKKPVFSDGVRAALIAAVLIGITVLVTVSLIIANSVINNPAEEPVSRVGQDRVADDPKPVTNVPVQDVPAAENTLPAKPPAVPPRDNTVKIPDTPVQPRTTPVQPVSGQGEKRVVQTTPAAQNPGAIERPPEPIPRKKGTIILVIDDAGNNLHELAPFLTFSGPMTIAVLPGLPYSAEAARRIRAAGKEVILHQPMEAIGGQNPGPGAIYTGMSSAEIRTVLEKNLAEVGPVAGINNHQGSKVTMDEKAMETILSVCHDRGIYFLDSRTTADTVVPAIAGRRGLKIWERDVFLDNIQEKAAMIRSIHEGLQKAEKKGGAIMIGHVWSSELAATLEELYPDMVEQGFSLSIISKVMMGTIDNDGFGD